jgi:hypothetical protein
MTSIRTSCESSYMPMRSMAVVESGRRCCASSRQLANSEGESIAHRSRRHAHQRTIRRASYLTATALRCPWKTRESCGSNDYVLNGGLRIDKQVQENNSRPSNSGT